MWSKKLSIKMAGLVARDSLVNYCKLSLINDNIITIIKPGAAENLAQLLVVAHALLASRRSVWKMKKVRGSSATYVESNWPVQPFVVTYMANIVSSPIDCNGRQPENDGSVVKILPRSFKSRSRTISFILCFQTE